MVSKYNCRNHLSFFIDKGAKALDEHPYGTIKRHWGFSYILTKKGMNKTSSDVGLMFIAYNLRRIGNILTAKVLKEYLRILVALFQAIFDYTVSNLMIFEEPFLAEIKLTVKNRMWHKHA